MVDDLRRPGTMPGSPESRSRAASGHSAAAALFESLQWLRERVLERMDSLEALARQRSAATPATGETASRERALELKLDELEETERRLSAQAERQEREWNASLIQLEADRRLLAEAWERVERERIEYLGASDPHAQGQGQQNGPPAALAHADAPVPTGSITADSDPKQPAAQAILRQFETLCGDVRRNAAERRDSRCEGRRPYS
jgi:hypothetical protein